LSSKRINNIVGPLRFILKISVRRKLIADNPIENAYKKAEVNHRPSYQLRHTFASLCLQQGAEATWVSKMLGHASLQITFKYYARYIDDKSGRNEAKLENFLSERKGLDDVSSFVHTQKKS
jgi:integrase